MVINSKIVSREFLGLLNLSGAQVLYIHEPTEVVIVREHKNFMLTTFKIMPSGFQSFNNGQKLSIIGFVSSLSHNHLPREISY